MWILVFLLLYAVLAQPLHTWIMHRHHDETVHQEDGIASPSEHCHICDFELHRFIHPAVPDPYRYSEPFFDFLYPGPEKTNRTHDVLYVFLRGPPHIQSV